MKYKNSISTEQLWKEYCPGKTPEEIAEHFDVSIGYVRQRLSFYKIKDYKKRSSSKFEGLEEYAKQHTSSECADYYNVSRSYISYILREKGIKAKQRNRLDGTPAIRAKRTGESREMILTLCNYYSFGSIARVFGYSKERVRQIYYEEHNENV